MSSPYVGEIRMFGGTFAPAGWAMCQGQLMPISQNDTLFNLIGTTYGGDGQSTFALPNLQSRVPVHVGVNFALGQSAGVEAVTLTTNQIPAHSHVPQAFATAGNLGTPANGVWAFSNSGLLYGDTAPNTVMAASAIGQRGVMARVSHKP